MGAIEPRDVRFAARAAAYAARHTADPAYAAAAAANTVFTSTVYLAYSASSVCDAVHRCAAQGGLDLNALGFAAQSRRVEFLRQAMQQDHVQLLVSAHADNPAIRPILWDAMLDAGYTPQPVQLAGERTQDAENPASSSQSSTGKTLRNLLTWWK
jgi:hypothetical protein